LGILLGKPDGSQYAAGNDHLGWPNWSALFASPLFDRLWLVSFSSGFIMPIVAGRFFPLPNAFALTAIQIRN